MRAATLRPFDEPYGARRVGAASKRPSARGAGERSIRRMSTKVGSAGRRAWDSSSSRSAAAACPPMCNSHV